MTPMAEKNKIGAEENQTLAGEIADRLRSIYQSYNCESDLPKQEDLVAIINTNSSLGEMLQDAMEINNPMGGLAPISYEEALSEVKKIGRFREAYNVLAVALTITPPSEFKAGIKAGIILRLGALQLKELFLPNSARAKKYMELHNQEARINFRDVKREIEFELYEALGQQEKCEALLQLERDERAEYERVHKPRDEYDESGHEYHLNVTDGCRPELRVDLK